MPAPKGNKHAVGNPGGGRPTAYNPRFIGAARELAAVGYTNFRIAQAFGVSEDTLYAWRRRYPEFNAACTPSPEERIAAMHEALFHRGVGYSHKAVKFIVVNGAIEEREYVEHYPPDAAAAKYYLNNRDRANWSERTEVEQSGAVTVRVVGGLPEQEDEK